MIYYTFKNFYAYPSVNSCKDTNFYSFEYSEKVLDLNCPKLISPLDFLVNNSTSFPKPNQAIDNSLNSEKSGSHNSDKKYKINTYLRDDSENKKNKNKNIKKKRSISSDISNDDIFLDSKDDVFSKDTLDLSILKSRRVNSKIKKKNKLKIENLDFGHDLSSISGKAEDIKNLNLSKVKNTVVIKDSLTVEQLSLKLSIPEAEIITYLFLEKGISITINQTLDVSIAKQVALHYDFTLLDSNSNIDHDLPPKNVLNSSDSVSRPPIITILGHVDHGKTTLLDAILKTNLVVKESGRITQAISGYEMQFQYGFKTYELVFLDTPGHQSFKQMRLRGAKITDIALLVVAFNDGLKPQTIEAINYIKEMNLSCILVVTKTDQADQDIDFILQELSTYSLVYEKWGGDLPVVQVSGFTGRNIDKLLSQICLICDAKGFVANPSQLASGIIFESYLDKKQGPIACIVVRNGTLKVGDIIVSSCIYGRVKSIINISLQKVALATPSSIVQILGFSSLPQAGSTFHVVTSDKEAKQFCANYSHQNTNLHFPKGLSKSMPQDRNSNIPEIRLIVKADTQGSLEALIDLLITLPQSKVKLHIVSANFGIVSSSDVELAILTQSIIVVFNLDVSSGVSSLVKKHAVVLKTYKVIYDLFQYVENKMLDLIQPNYDKIFIGRASVRTVFHMNKGCVAGCYVDQGKIIKMCHISVYRNEEIVYEGILISLKISKDDVNEVLFDNECGLMCDYNLWQKNDIIHAYELVPRKKTL
uniref:Translation initiation factor IF-2, chloroplastic n=1 Tax=Palisada sp. TaxID=1955416 RepID=A0A1Z1MSG1_9FLOR|nr:translation initiation factor 2 [Palisada sp.]